MVKWFATARLLNIVLLILVGYNDQPRRNHGLVCHNRQAMPLLKKHLFRQNDKKFTNRLHKIRVFRNGDHSYKGQIFKFRKANFRDFPDLLAAITKEMQDSIFLHTGGITFLYNLNGTVVTSVDELVDGGDYAAACLNEPFKYVLYPVQSRTVLSQASTTLIKSKSLASLRCRSASALSFTSLDYRAPATPTFRPRHITIVQGTGEPPRRIFRVHLTNSNATHFQMVMDAINQHAKFDDGKPLDRVFRENCVEVRCLEDFFDDAYVFYAFPKCRIVWDMLDLSACEDEIVAELNNVPAAMSELKRNFPPSVTSAFRVQKMRLSNAFTTVHACVQRSTHRRCQLKIVQKPRNIPFIDAVIKPDIHEIYLLLELHHPNIISILFTDETADALYAVTESWDDEDLRHSIDNIRQEECLPLMDNLASALAYLHLRGIAHRDICPTNILLKTANNQRKLVLSEFNHAARIEEPQYDIAGFLVYMAPEMVARTGYGLKVDIWSAGMVLFLMATKDLPFVGDSVDKVTRSILKQPIDYEEDKWDDVDVSVKILIDLMLCRNAVTRITAGEVLAFIANVRDGHYHKYEFDRYWEIENETRKRLRDKHSIRSDLNRKRRMK